ncbi:MAG: UvrD-helicase domain-containing protein [Dokdonella sp.]
MTEPLPRHVTLAEDWCTLPLAPGGRSLIEASAGTGKTWTISVLYLRLLLEPAAPDAPPLTPRQIVVATFTDAAAQELRARVRARLIWAEQLALDAIATQTFVAAADAAPDTAWLYGRWSADAAQAKRDLQRLRLALAELDMAPITTLHGLCRRILVDYPFESGSAFGLGEMVSDDSVLEQLAEDLWRRLQQGPAAPPSLVSASTRAALKARLKLCLTPGVGLWAPSEDEIARALSKRTADTLDAFAAREGIWSPTPTGRQSATLRKSIAALANWVRDHDKRPGSTAMGHLANRAELLDLQQRDALLAEPAMQTIATILRYQGYAAAATDVAAWQTWTAEMRTRRDERLAAAAQLTFDDLLSRVHGALVDDSRGLADRLFAEWKVALIDEFQDTDAQQYAILDRIYRDEAGAPRGRLVMIGDPKQAIYRFRGGDIATYLAAAQRIDSKVDLHINYRSSRAYVAALNELFAHDRAVLSADAQHPIRVQPVAASSRCDKEPYQAPDGEAAQPLVLHYNAEVPAGAGERRALALAACANQIAAMLQDDRYRIGERRVEPGDIAVLLPTNPQIVEMRSLLQERHVPCVGAGKSSVFETDWARELQVVLYAVENAGDEGAVRAALATRLGGLDFAQLRDLRDAPQQWQPYAQRFAELQHRWQRDGVLAVVLDFAQRAMARVPLAAERERALTDLRHLGELLQEQAETLHGASQLLAWLADQRSGEGGDGGDAADDKQLRIESDAKRVRLMTLHASKGLEFPIVFLPLMWAHGKHVLDKTAVIHEPLCDRRVIGFGAEAEAQYNREGQDERFRVLYVALTRAIHACHVYAMWPGRASSARSSKAQVDPERSALDVLIERLLARGNGAVHLPHVRWIDAPWQQERADFCPPLVATNREPHVLRSPGRPPFESTWSFSALTRPRTDSLREEAPADDEATIEAMPPDDTDVTAALEAAPAAAPHPTLLELATLRGPDFGNALHTMFETRQIGVPMIEQRDLVRRALRAEGVRVGELPVDTALTRIASRLDGVLAAELASGLHLGAVSAREQRAEMAFHFVLDAVSVKRLREACVHHGEVALVPPGIALTTLRGLMTGKIDLVFEHAGRFHILDYKSNNLGDRLDAYMPDALGVAMDAHHYRFQALLYTIAVERYLRQRIVDYQRDQHLGEAIYLFVRAVGLAPGAGVWRHRFDDALLDAVDAVFSAPSTQEAA